MISCRLSKYHGMFCKHACFEWWNIFVNFRGIVCFMVFWNTFFSGWNMACYHICAVPILQCSCFQWFFFRGRWRKGAGIYAGAISRFQSGVCRCASWCSNLPLIKFLGHADMRIVGYEARWRVGRIAQWWFTAYLVVSYLVAFKNCAKGQTFFGSLR